MTTREGEPISILATKNERTGKQPYFCNFVFNKSRFSVRLENNVEVAESASSPPEYNIPKYHREYKLTYNFSHYLDDHEDRVSDKLPDLNQHQRFLCIFAALELAHRREAAVPQ